jgi:hypothetical protein
MSFGPGALSLNGGNDRGAGRGVAQTAARVLAASASNIVRGFGILSNVFSRIDCTNLSTTAPEQTQERETKKMLG